MLKLKTAFSKTKESFKKISDRFNEDVGFTLSQVASKKKTAKRFFSQCHLLDTVPSDQ